MLPFLSSGEWPEVYEVSWAVEISLEATYLGRRGHQGG